MTQGHLRTVEATAYVATQGCGAPLSHHSYRLGLQPANTCKRVRHAWRGAAAAAFVLVRHVPVPSRVRLDTCRRYTCIAIRRVAIAPPLQVPAGHGHTGGSPAAPGASHSTHVCTARTCAFQASFMSLGFDAFRPLSTTPSMTFHTSYSAPCAPPPSLPHPHNPLTLPLCPGLHAVVSTAIPQPQNLHIMLRSPRRFICRNSLLLRSLQQALLSLRADGTVATCDEPPVVLGRLPPAFVQSLNTAGGAAGRRAGPAAAAATQGEAGGPESGGAAACGAAGAGGAGGGAGSQFHGGKLLRFSVGQVGFAVVPVLQRCVRHGVACKCTRARASGPPLQARAARSAEKQVKC